MKNTTVKKNHSFFIQINQLLKTSPPTGFHFHILKTGDIISSTHAHKKNYEKNYKNYFCIILLNFVTLYYYIRIGGMENGRDKVDFLIIDAEQVSDGWQTTYTYNGVQDVCEKTSVLFGDWVLCYVIKLIDGYYIKHLKVEVSSMDKVYELYLKDGDSAE